MIVLQMSSFDSSTVRSNTGLPRVPGNWIVASGVSLLLIAAVGVGVLKGSTALAGGAAAAIIAYALTAAPHRVVLAVLFLVSLPLAPLARTLPSPVRGMGLQFPVLVALLIVVRINARTGDFARVRGRDLLFGLFVLWALVVTVTTQGVQLASTLPWLASVWIFLDLSRFLRAKPRVMRAAIGALAGGIAAGAFLDRALVIVHSGLLGTVAVTTDGVTDPTLTTRFAGLLGDWELLPELLVLGTVLLTWLATTASTRMQRVASVVGIALCIWDAAASNTRGPFLLLVPACLIVVTVSASHVSKGAAFAVTVVAGMWSLLALVGAGEHLPLVSRLADVGRSGAGVAGFLNRSVPWSILMARPEFHTNMWTGNGLTYPFQSIGIYPHSLYLTLIYEVGLLGLGLLSLFLLWLARDLLVQVRWSRRGPATALLATLLVLLLDEVKIEFSRLPLLVVVFGALLALSSGASSYSAAGASGD